MSSLAANDRPEAPLFSDGLGERVVAADGATGELLQILRLRPALTSVPSFEFALRERTARLANFRHAYYVRVRRVDRAMAPTSALAIVSDHLEGTRLSDILRVADDKQLQIDINAALCLIRQLVPAVSVLHENARDVAHGLIAPERLIVTPNARLVIVEHVLGAAIEQLQFGRDRLWQEFRVAMPPSAGLPRFDHRADVTGMGLVALALILGRPLAADEYPHRIPDLLNEARERSALGDEQPLSQALRTWLARALQIDVRRSFASAPEAMAALDEVVSDDGMYVAAPVALETFLSRYIASLLEPTASEPVPRFDTPLASPRDIEDLTTALAADPVEPRITSPSADVATTTDVDIASRLDAALAYHAPAVMTPAAPAADPAPPPSAIAAARDITELLGPGPPLPGVDPVVHERRPLFDPDAPFTAIPVLPPPPVRSGSSSKRYVVLAALVILLTGVAAVGYRTFGVRSAAPAMGALVVQSNPSGIAVFVDGIEQGKTPARVTVAPGSHILELRGRGVPRVIPLNVTAGAEVSQYLEFAEAPVTGQLAIQSEPAGAKVIVDGTERGVAPVTIFDLAPGDHRVELLSDGAVARHTVNVQAGGTASLVVPIGGASTAGPVSGWISIKAPFTLEIREQGRLLGTTDADRLMVAAGRHELDFVSESLGYRASRVVQVAPGKVAALTLDLPQGVINLNAAPWAEVWIDGRRVGDTPIGNLSIAIGPHEVVFKHPQLGEKRHAISVSLGAPVRLSVDMK
jgi:archaellum component FlaG (FlaF/FlaG flagellin family)